MTTLSRRRFAGALAALPTTAALAATVLARPTAGVATPPALAQRRVGRFTVTMVSDGFVDLPYGVFTGIDPAALEAGARARFIHRPTGVSGPASRPGSSTTANGLSWSTPAPPV
jgi:hypothetical protein